jgi:iron complex transport system substrate-binding protein
MMPRSRRSPLRRLWSRAAPPASARIPLPRGSRVAAVAAGRVYQWLGLPYGWGARPPSVNRLPGLMWLAYVLPGRAFDAPFYDQVRGFFNDFYHVELGDPSLRKLVQE